MMKLTYLQLLSRTTPHDRLVLASGREMADDMGISYRSFRDHVRALLDAELIDSFPFRELQPYVDSNREVMVMLDLQDEMADLLDIDD